MHQDISAFFLKPIVPKILCGVFSLLIVAQFLYAMNFLREMNLTQQSKASLPLERPESRANIHHHLVKPFFGVYVADANDQSNIKQSMLNFTVVGIMHSINPLDSAVMIRLISGEEKSYRVGDALPGGVIIKKITSQGVFVEHNGELESLSLPKTELIFEPPAKPLFKE